MKNLLTLAMSLLCSLAAISQPTVSSFTPVSGTTGMTITIDGTGFSTASNVSIGSVNVPFTIVSDTRITVVLPVVASGPVRVTNPSGNGSLAGFIYVPTSGIITDFNGFWRTTAAAPTGVNPDNSHNLLAFTHNGVTYSTGVNNATLTNNNITFTSAVFKALPVASIAGTNSGSGSIFIALASKVDGSATTAYVPGASSYNIKKALVDGVNGLDLGTGVTNLPSSAIMTFQIFNIDGARATDAEPDIILTQIASPASSNDVFTFLDASGNTVGTSFTQDMTYLPRLGTYTLDLFNMPTGVSYNTAYAYSVANSGTNTTRDIRMVSLNLSDFGINASNASQVRALRITPSGNSDYAFIGYNAAAINLPPNVTISSETSVSNICPGGTASLEVIGTPASGGTLSYTWEESVNNGASWTTVTNGGNYSGANTSRLRVAAAVAGRRYRAVIAETGNGNNSRSGEFIITNAAGTNPSAVTISGGTTTCSNASVILSSSVTGGTNLNYQWQSNASGSYTDIPGANGVAYIPPTNQTGAVGYRLVVSNGSGCTGVTSGATTVTVNGISSTTPATRCQAGALTLQATASSGNVSWYTAETGGTAVFTGNNYNIASVSATTTYYAEAAGCALRVPVVATVHPASAVGMINRTTGSDPTTAVLTISSQTGEVVKWQSSTDNFISVINDIANTSSQLIVSKLGPTQQYRAVVQSGTCAAVTSSQLAVLPVRAGSIELTDLGGNVLVQWETYDQTGATVYEVERSTDGRAFVKAGAVAPHAGAQYDWLDTDPGTGTVYYRIREVRLNGSSNYSDIASIRLGNPKAGIQVFPNPLSSGNLRVRFSQMNAGVYDLRLYNTTGQVVYNGKLNHSGGSATQPVNVPGQLAAGIYTLVVTDAAGTRTNMPLLVRYN
jgi:hypothetical protein